MTAVIYTRPPNRLGKLLTAPGGRKIAAALAEAEANLAAMRAQVTGEVDAALERLRQAAMLAAAADPDACSDVYAHASAIAGFSGLCGLVHLGQVAFNLCELTDRYIEGGVWNTAAVGAHLDTMALLRHADLPADSAEGKAVLEGLKALVRRAEEQAAPGD